MNEKKNIPNVSGEEMNALLSMVCYDSPEEAHRKLIEEHNFTEEGAYYAYKAGQVNLKMWQKYPLGEEPRSPEETSKFAYMKR